MTNLLSAISGQFSKNLILGTFMPVSIFVILNLIFVVPLFPYEWQFFTHLQTFDSQGIVGIFFITVVITGLLYNLNIPIIRFYEGYPWKDSLIGRWCTNHYRSRLRRENSIRAHAQLFHVKLTLRGSDEPPDESTVELLDDVRIDAERQQKIRRIGSMRAQIGRRINTEFPMSEGSILPTRLGNVVRSFEDYPQRQYNMAAITLWPRLIANINKDYAASIDDAKTSFDFMMNCSVLSVFTALAILFIGLIYPIPLVSPQLLVPWLIKIVFFAVISYVTYMWSIGRASNWGDMVKGAFDLYRWDLLKQLGYKREPANLIEERELWGKVSRQMIYGYLYKEQLPEYSAPSTYAQGTPLVELAVSRFIDRLRDNDHLSVNINVKNTDALKRSAGHVVVIDTLPDGFELVWGSAFVSSGDGGVSEPSADVKGASREQGIDQASVPVPVMGVNPYRFTVGDISYGQEIVLSYLASQRKN